VVGAQHGAVIEHRVLEQLEADAGTSPITRHLTQRGGQPSTGAVAANRDALGVDPEIGGFVVEPSQRGVAVLEAVGERMLGRQSVVDAHDEDAELVGPSAAQRMALLGRTEHHASAVDPQEGASRADPIGALVVTTRN
jgi:hypothetical protein